jgi:uncharacterized protein YkwD
LPHVAATPETKRLEHAMHQRLNRDRARQGLPALAYDERLADVARYHSADMRDNGYFAHESKTSGTLEDRLNRAGYLFQTARENLSIAPDVERSQDGLLKSPPHYANIMSPDVTHVGIGIVKGSTGYPENLTVTQVFARPGRVESAQSAEHAMIQEIQAQRQRRGLPRAARHPLLSELAERHVDDLGGEANARRLEQVGSSVTAEVQKRRDHGLGAVVVGAQLISESSTFSVPDRLLQPKSTGFGLAVRQVPGRGGRPMLLVLILVGVAR